MTDRDASPATEALRRSLDRAVIRGRALRLAAIVGCWATCAGVIWCVDVALQQAFGGRSEFAAAPWAMPAGIATAAALVTAVIFRAAVFAGRWPTRLAVAIETERRDHRLGERISRAVGFLDEPVADRREPAADAALADGLRQLAIEQARGTLPGRLAVPGATDDLKWIAAGLFAAAAVAVTAVVVPLPRGGTPHEEAAVPTPQPANNTGDTDDVTSPKATQAAVVRRLRAVAKMERRVADVATMLFAESPGASRESLPRETQSRLDRLASIQSEVCTAVRAVREEIRGLAGAPAARVAACLGELDAFVRVGGESLGEHIAANRLGLGGDRAASAADALAAAAHAWGADASVVAADARVGDDLRLVRLTMVLDELAVAPGESKPDAVNGSDGRAAAEEPAGTPAAAARAAVGDIDATGRTAAPGGALTTSPAQTAAGSAAADLSTAASAGRTGAGAADRGWRPPAGKQAECPPVATGVPEDAPAAYRQAVAEYYRLLRKPSTESAGGTDPGHGPHQR